MKKTAKKKKSAATSVKPLVTNVTLTVLDFPSVEQSQTEYPDVGFSMSLDKSYKGASLQNGTTLVLRAPRGKPVQINFRLAQNLTTAARSGQVARYQLAGLSFSGLEVLLAGAPGAKTPSPSNQFPSILGACQDRLEGFLKTGKEIVSYSIPPHTMSAIDLNKADQAVTVYSFVAMVQQIDPSGVARYGIIDPQVVNEASDRP